MATVAIANTTANISGKTVTLAERDHTITGSWTFDRDPSAPFTVSAGSAVVTNLDADKVDGIEASAFLLLAGGTMVGDLKFTDGLYDIGKSGATRPRDGFFSRNVAVGGTLGVTGATTLAATAITGDVTGTYALKGSPTIWNIITTTSTGTQNNFAPGLVGNTLVRCNNASLLTITGVAGGYDGQLLAFVSINAAGQVDFAHNSGSSSAGNKLVNFVSSGNTSIAAAANLGGVAIYQYSTTDTIWRLIHHEQGPWITRTFAAGNYTASAGNWTVASATLDAYMLRGRTLLYGFNVSGTTSGTPVTVKIALPFTSNSPSTTAFYNQNPGTGVGEGGYCNSAASSTVFSMQRFNNTAYAAGTVTVSGQIAIEVT